MADTVKKTKVPGTPRQASGKKAKDAGGAKPAKAAGKGIELVAKVAAPKKAAAAKPRKAAVKTEKVVAISEPGNVSRELIARVAYLKWVQRGYQHGYALEDWIKAERELLGRAS